MDKKNRILIIILSIIFIGIVFITNILIKRYERKGLIPIPEKKEIILKEEIQPESSPGPAQTPMDEEEYEPPLGNDPLIN